MSNQLLSLKNNIKCRIWPPFKINDTISWLIAYFILNMKVLSG